MTEANQSSEVFIEFSASNYFIQMKTFHTIPVSPHPPPLPSYLGLLLQFCVSEGGGGAGESEGMMSSSQAECGAGEHDFFFLSSLSGPRFGHLNCIQICTTAHRPDGPLLKSKQK